MGRRRQIARGAVPLSFGAVAILAACLVPGACTGRGKDLPDIVLVTVDTLRPDHLTGYGYERKTSPYLDALAAESLVFRNAYSPCSWTAPSMASLFTSLYPLEHGVRKGIFSPDEMQVVQQEAIPPSLPTLTSWLKDRGYTTIGIATNPHTGRDLGFARGFDRWEEHSILIRVGRELREEPDLEKRDQLMREKFQTVLDDPFHVNDLALSHLAAVPAGRPFFLWVHYMNVHWPYLPKEPWFREYFGGDVPDMIALYRDYLPATPRRIEIEKGSEAFRYLVAAYDSQVNLMDEVLHALLERLPRPDRTAIVFTADHGESFLDHGLLFHGNSLHEEEIRVPLLVRLPLPQRRHAEVERLASLLDVVPTIQALVAGKPEPWARGESLLDARAGAPVPGVPERALLAEFGREEKSIQAFMTQRWKLIFDTRALRKEVYDLSLDPHETRDLSADRQDLRRKLLDRLNEERSRLRKGQPTVVTRRIEAADLDTLRALGYAAGPERGR